MTEGTARIDWLELLLVPLGFVVGAYGTIVGAGGGFVLVPLLLLIYPDEEPATITSISLGVVFFNAVSGSWAYARLKRIDYRSGLAFAAAALPGAIAGVFLVHIVPRALFDILFGVALLSVAAYTIWQANRTQAMRPPVAGRFVVRRVMPGADEGTSFRYSFNMAHGVAISAVIGLLSSLLGIGGGVFQVPAMVNVLRFPVHVAVATSQFVLMFMSGEASALHLLNGAYFGEDAGRVLLLALGAIPGAQVGARLAQRFRGTLISRLLALALVVVGARLLYAGITA